MQRNYQMPTQGFFVGPPLLWCSRPRFDEGREEIWTQAASSRAPRCRRMECAKCQATSGQGAAVNEIGAFRSFALMKF